MVEGRDDAFRPESAISFLAGPNLDGKYFRQVRNLHVR